jgi:hypothetical protein
MHVIQANGCADAVHNVFVPTVLPLSHKCIFVQSNTSLKPSKIVRQWMKQVQLAEIMRDSPDHVP